MKLTVDEMRLALPLREIPLSSSVSEAIAANPLRAESFEICEVGHGR